MKMKFNKQVWDLNPEYENWLKYSSNKTENFGLQESTLDCLKNGIPEDAAPFLSFYSDDNFIRLKTLKAIFCFDRPETENFIVFGHDGNGNPLCIDKTENERIILFDHDNEFNIITVNDSLSEFLNCLLLYRNFVKSYSISENKYNLEDVERLMDKMQKVNPKLLNCSVFWQNEINQLREHACI